MSKISLEERPALDRPGEPSLCISNAIPALRSANIEAISAILQMNRPCSKEVSKSAAMTMCRSSRW